MNLEQRVLAVEQELQVLKTQIQVTLLTIQEHLLNNKYPALRANDPLPKTSSATEAQASATRSNVVKRIALTEIESEPEAIAEEQPMRTAVHPEPFSPRLSMSGETKNTGQHHQPAAARPMTYEPKDAEQHYQAADVRLWIELDKWVNQKIKEVGIHRTRDLISLFDGPEQPLLMQVLHVYDQGLEMERPYNAPAPPRSATAPPRAVAEEWQKLANTNKVPNATYRPFGEHQELALRLIADILNAQESAPVGAISNGRSKH